MILYDKKSNFLGISQNELSILGYEDIEEFKSYHDDFANLFLNHPGYISKFKNFSWIDYALHSGVPNKNVILKHKNETELEAKLQISEIYLIDKLNEETSIYNIEIIFSQPTNILNTTKTLNPEADNSFQPIINEIPTAKIKKEELKHDDFIIEDYSEQTNEDISNQIEIKDKEVLNLDEDNQNFKLKVNFEENETSFTTKELHEENNEEAKQDDFTIEDYSEQTDEDKTLVPSMALHEDNEIIIDVKGTDFNFEDIDFTQIAEDTGIDLENIAIFINDFIKESEDSTTLIKLPQNINNHNFVKNEIMKLKGIASNLKIKNFTKILNSMLGDIGTDKFEKKLNLYEKQIKDLEEKLF